MWNGMDICWSRIRLRLHVLGSWMQHPCPTRACLGWARSTGSLLIRGGSSRAALSIAYEALITRQRLATAICSWSRLCLPFIKYEIPAGCCNGLLLGLVSCSIDCYTSRPRASRRCHFTVYAQNTVREEGRGLWNRIHFNRGAMRRAPAVPAL